MTAQKTPPGMEQPGLTNLAAGGWFPPTMLRHPSVAAFCARWGWSVAGVLLMVAFAAVLALSPQFAYARLPVLERPIGTFVALMVIAGAIYLLAIWWLKPPAQPTRAWWLWIIFVGLVVRALMIPSTPILETDYFRYLWDGAVLAHGHNPYEQAPQAILDGEGPRQLVQLGEASSPVLQRVNQPQLSTIYPPSAQIAFAAAHWIAPWRIEGLRVLFLFFDLITFGLLVALLRQLALPPAMSVVYWWNPLLIKEGFNTAHMEMTLLPLLVAALLLVVRWRLLAGMVALAAAAGAKLWPVLLLPAMLRRSGVSPVRALMAGGVGAGLCILIVAPMLLARLDQQAGLVAYAATWQVNASLYQLILALVGLIYPADPQMAARVMVAMLLLGWIVWLCRRPAADGRALCRRGLWITAALFLLSPTQFPWYWLWLLPMLAVHPSPGLLILTAMLPLYYLRFPLREMDLTPWFNHGVVWVQFLPAYMLLGLEAWRSLRRPENAQPEV